MSPAPEYAGRRELGWEVLLRCLPRGNQRRLIFHLAHRKDLGSDFITVLVGLDGGWLMRELTQVVTFDSPRADLTASSQPSKESTSELVATLLGSRPPATTQDDSTLRDELLNVARKHRGLQFCDAPALRDLIDVVSSRFFSNNSNPTRREALGCTVTDSLMNDVAAAARIQRLWKVLESEVSSAG